MSTHQGHGHSLPANPRVLMAVLAISVSVLVAEIVGALVSGSLALFADAGHMLTDVAGLSLAVIAAALTQRPATLTRTWGYRRAEVLAAAAQAAVLLAVGAFVLVEGARRLVEPPDVDSTVMVAFGLVGLVGNTVSMGLLLRRRAENLNTRAAFLEVVNDALGALAVLVAAVVIATTGWLRADAVVSILIGLLIIPRTWKLLREAVDVLLEATPKSVDLAQVKAHLLGVDHVMDVHDMHATMVSSDLPILTAHVVVEDRCFRDDHLPRMLDEIQRCVAGHFDVEHSTFQFEAQSHIGHERSAHA